LIDLILIKWTNVCVWARVDSEMDGRRHVRSVCVCVCVCWQDIYSENPDVHWDDIIGLDAAKRLVKEAVVYPIRVTSRALRYIRC